MAEPVSRGEHGQGEHRCRRQFRKAPAPAADRSPRTAGVESQARLHGTSVPSRK